MRVGFVRLIGSIDIMYITVTAADTCQRRHCSVPGLGLPREQLQDLHGDSCSETEKYIVPLKSIAIAS